ncbi:MAG: GFA family protein [Gammaproteobacteria bacterium]|jgi:hypothetical protein
MKSAGTGLRPVLGPEYGVPGDQSFVPRHEAACRCGAVRYEVAADPVTAKICHCTSCQRLHAAPMQWAAIFHKRDVRLVAGLERLRFYSEHTDRPERIPPCKIRCARCGSPIADEGRRMWLAFPELFDFGSPRRVPHAFRPSCHIFYRMRVVDVDDDLPKWAGHQGESSRL